MRTLHVQNFSCIVDATLELRRVNLIIGPQASGKSVLCKLAHFFIDIPSLQANAISKGENFEKFSGRVKKAFVDWFPPQAWGQEKFKIEFKAGGYAASISRSVYADKIRDDCRLKFSAEFKAQFELLSSEARDLQESSSDRDPLFLAEYRLQEALSKSLERLMGPDMIDQQVFIPAGRSFFTSIGKAIAIFDQGKLLDPLILKFGRMYAAYRENPRRLNRARADQQTIRLMGAILRAIVGGELVEDGENEVLKTKDGRKIPLNSLSSGQQELIPMMAILPAMFNPRYRSICYVEEPEAHLFPSSQGQLLEALVLGANSGPPSSQTNLVMTTHSPYVLAKLNNLLKAGAVGVRLSDAGRKELESVVSRRCWLRSRNVRAYAIESGRLVNIVGADGFIDGDYLDMASGQLSDEFDQLLEIEAKHGQ